MSKPTTREELKQYALRKLGAPVIEINVDDSQLEDSLDDAIQMFNEYHFDGVERVLYKHEITETDIQNGFIDVPIPSEPLDQMDILKLKIQKNLFL